MYNRRSQPAKAGAMKRFNLVYTEVLRDGVFPPFGDVIKIVATGTDAVSVLKSLTRYKDIVQATAEPEAGGRKTQFKSNYLNQLNAAVKAFDPKKGYWSTHYTFMRDGAFRLDGVTYTIHDPWSGSYQEEMTEDELKVIGRALNRSK